MKNAGATYKRLVIGISKDLMETKIEVYVDNMVVKVCSLEDHLRDINQLLDILDKVSMKFNPKKMIKVGKFFSYIVSKKEIEANPEKIKAILDMKVIRCINNIQKLNKRVTKLGYSISCSVKRCLSFLKVLKKKNNFI